MNAWLYKRLNHTAKAWPYYVGHRAKQRECIKNNLQTILAALTTRDAHATKGHGCNALHYESAGFGYHAVRHWKVSAEFGIQRNRCDQSQFGDYELETYKLCGIPTIDMTTAKYADLAKLVISGPMIAFGKQQADGTGALSYCSLAYAIAQHRLIGSTVYNWRD